MTVRDSSIGASIMFALRLIAKRKYAPNLSKFTAHHLLFTTRRKATAATVDKKQFSSNEGLVKPHLEFQPSSGYTEVKVTEKIEEETITCHEPEDYYPIYIGEVIKSRYQVVAKQGYGVGSTVWLCRDLKGGGGGGGGGYLTLKVCVRRAKQLGHELRVSEHLKKHCDNSHPGKNLVQVVLDSFEIDGPNGRHVCLLYQTLGMKLTEWIKRMPDGVMPVEVLQKVTQFVLIALDYLHRHDVVHTDICMNNVLQSISNETILTNIEEDELCKPIPRKKLHDRHIYYSRAPPTSTGLPILCDFGDARVGKAKQQGAVMFESYRPPEILLDMQWDFKIDIWGLGLMVWRMLEGTHLFTPHQSGTLDEERHLAEMVSLLGPPPAEFLLRSRTCSKYWDEKGTWKGVIPLADWSLESKERRLAGYDHELFLKFIRKILCWLPEDRPAAGELVYDDFLMQAVLASAIETTWASR